MKLTKIIDKIEQFYPLYLAENWDNVGLQVGSETKEVHDVLTALELTDEVIEEAIENEVDLIICHHPVIFKPIKDMNSDNLQNKKIIKLIKHDIALYVVHTNIDVAYNGINDWLCEVLEVTNISPLKNTYELDMFLVNIEVDIQNLDVILDTLTKFGFCKQIYDKEEQFLMYPKVKNYKDNRKGIMRTKDVTIIETKGTKEQINILKKHLYSLKTEKKIYAKMTCFLIDDYKIYYGIGRYGYIKPMSLEHLAEIVKKKFSLNHVRIVGSLEKTIKKVSIVGGSGASYIQDAYDKGCDVLITGDIGFHDAQQASDLGIALIDGGHILEIIFNDGMKEFLDLISNINVIASEININPFEVI